MSEEEIRGEATSSGQRGSIQRNKDGVVVSGDPEIVERVIKALKEVYDPEIPVNVYDLGLIYEIHVEKGKSGRPVVYILMTLTAPGCPVAGTVAAFAEEAVREAVPEAEDVIVEITFDPPWDPDRVTEEGREMLKAIFGYDVVEQWKKQLQMQQATEEGGG
ncbi:MAG: iron-sulfur cluster assembly protein [Desulfurococcales archaeon]|nr:iron-sulfur cluster assembly protein [Desulfurococcales archaeon]